jgi:lipoyl synthase
MKKHERLPSWLRRPLPRSSDAAHVEKMCAQKKLHTVCEEAQCPNMIECWSRRNAAFLIMGSQCTRSCAFCSIAHSPTPPPLDPEEPNNIAAAIQNLGLSHAVITMVTRDDLTDGGANHLAETIRCTRTKNPDTTIEVLTSDFSGETSAYDIVIESHPDIFNHNIETVRSLSPRIRHKASYATSLRLLSYVKSKTLDLDIMVKSGIMLGLGEKDEEVKETIQDLYDHGCDIITVGQYMRASSNNLAVKEYITPETFQEYEEYGYTVGVKHMYCGPFVRSSYNADQILKKQTDNEVYDAQEILR